MGSVDRRAAAAIIVACTTLVVILSAPAPAQAAGVRVAMFGGGTDAQLLDNAVDELLVAHGYEVVLVTDAQLATPGYLEGFDVFLYSRDGASAGTSLTAEAAANVVAFAGPGRRVLLNGDFADAVNPAVTGGSDPNVEQLFLNAVAWTAESHHGFVGEYTGTAAALTSNGDMLAALGLVHGTAGKLYSTGALGPIELTAQASGSPVLDDVAFPTDPYDVSYGPIVTGVDPVLILAVYRWNPGNPAIVAQDAPAMDTTAPTITPAVSGTIGRDGWYLSDVGVSWVVEDLESTVTSTTGCDPTTVAADTDATGYAVVCSATSAGGNASVSVTIRRDATAPELHVSGAASGTTFDVCTAAPTRPAFSPADPSPGSGLDGTGADAWSTPGTATGAGAYAYTARAADVAGTVASETRTYRAVYGSAFSGFLQPKADGTSRFSVGATVKIRFRLSCNGVQITRALNMLAVEPGDTTGNAYASVPTSLATPSNSFAWDTRGQQYVFDLSTKTPYLNPGASAPTTFSPGIYTLRVELDDGTSRAVTIRLVK